MKLLTLIMRIAFLICVLALGSSAPALADECNCIADDCYQDVVITEAGIDATRGTYEFSGMTNGKPEYRNQADARIYYEALRWRIEDADGDYYRSSLGDTDTPPTSGWDLDTQGDIPLPRLAGGDSCTPCDCRIIVHETGEAANAYGHALDCPRPPLTATIVTAEGGQDTFTVALADEPGGDVLVTIDPSEHTSISSPNDQTPELPSVSLRFDALTWDVPVTITVMGRSLSGDGSEGSVRVCPGVAETIQLASTSSADPRFNGLQASLVVGIEDTQWTSYVPAGYDIPWMKGNTSRVALDPSRTHCPGAMNALEEYLIFIPFLRASWDVSYLFERGETITGWSFLTDQHGLPRTEECFRISVMTPSDPCVGTISDWSYYGIYDVAIHQSPSRGNPSCVWYDEQTERHQFSIDTTTFQEGMYKLQIQFSDGVVEEIDFLVMQDSLGWCTMDDRTINAVQDALTSSCRAYQAEH